jgi:hypothetical protein
MPIGVRMGMGFRGSDPTWRYAQPTRRSEGLVHHAELSVTTTGSTAFDTQVSAWRAFYLATIR